MRRQTAITGDRLLQVSFLTMGLLGAAAIGNVASQSVTGEKVRMCYWGSWSIYRLPPYTFTPNDIDVNLCTHLIFSFAGLNARTNKIYSMDPTKHLSCGQCEVNGGTGCPPPDDVDPVTLCGSCDSPEPGLFNQTVKLKERNPDLKVMIAIGGWCQGTERFSVMAGDPESRTVFIQSVVEYMELHHFDGLDLDWEYPGVDTIDCANSTTDPENYVALVKELREAFNEVQTQGNYLYLTAAVAASIETANDAYLISELNEHLDYFNLMTYDFKMWSSNTPWVGHHSPLYYKDWETEENKALTVSSAVQYYLEQGADPKKLVIGIGAYGKTFMLINSEDSFYDEAFQGPEGVGEDAGTIFYNEICERGSEFKYYFDYDYFIPYAKADKLWVGYDDEDSVMEKVDYAEKLGLGGMMVWSIDQDDFKNRCGGWYPFAIANTIKLRMEHHAKRRSGPECDD